MVGKLLLCGVIGLTVIACAPKPESMAHESAPASIDDRRASDLRPAAKDPMSRVDSVKAIRQLRQQALVLTPAELGLKPSKEFPRLFGVLMEWPLGNTNATVTVTSYATGDASLYTSAGFGVIGGVAHERVRAAAKRFVSVAAHDYDVAVPTSEFPSPTQGKVQFILLGYKGRRVIEGDIPSPLGRGRIFDLFAAGQNVLTELRLVTQTRNR